jgi:SAM-dependent methyltransferase
MRLIPRIRCRQALRIGFVRQWAGRWRLRKALWRGRLKTLDSKLSVAETLKHNLKSLSDFSNPRIELLIRPLSVIESTRAARSILLIGPRNENDLLVASTYFDLPLTCFRGLDLISYSKLIDLGDMHAMPYADDQFDVVICGWTLSYSSQPQRLADEMIRVCKSGGLIAVGVEYSTMADADYEEKVGYSLATPGLKRINSVSEIEQLFAANLSERYFYHDAPLKMSHTSQGFCDRPSGVATIFSIRKSTL